MISRREFLSYAACLGATALSACTSAPPGGGELSATFFCFDTVCQIKGAMDRDALDGASALCERYEQLFSRTIETSDIARVNAAGGRPVEVAPETADLIDRALAYCAASGGRFDITIGTVSALWDFRDGVVPDPDGIAAALPHIDYRTVVVDGTTVQLLDPASALDLGGIAKGWIADALIAYFSESGIESACVNLGGNVAVLGAKSDGSPWRVGIQDPDGARGAALIARVDITGGSVVTSGLYERSFEKDGRRFWHILDPKTGYPVETDTISATIYAPASLDADGHTKTLFFMEPEEGVAYLDGLGLDGLIKARDGAILTTAGAPFAIVGE